MPEMDCASVSIGERVSCRKPKLPVFDSLSAGATVAIGLLVGISINLLVNYLVHQQIAPAQLFRGEAIILWPWRLSRQIERINPRHRKFEFLLPSALA
jgi:hypothetical protein